MEVVIVRKGCQSQMHLERNDPMDQYRLAADQMETSLSEKCPVVPGRQQSDHEAADHEAFLRQRKPMASSATLGRVMPLGLGRRFFPSAQLW